MSNKRDELIRSVKFVLFSASAGIIQIISAAFFKEVLDLIPWICYLFSLILSVLWNFTLNRKFTFYSANNVTVAMLKVAVFYAIFTPLSTWWTAMFTENLHINYYAVQVGTMITNFVTEYFYDRFVVFGKSIDTAKKKKIIE